MTLLVLANQSALRLAELGQTTSVILLDGDPGRRESVTGEERLSDARLGRASKEQAKRTARARRIEGRRPSWPSSGGGPGRPRTLHRSAANAKDERGQSKKREEVRPRAREPKSSRERRTRPQNALDQSAEAGAGSGLNIVMRLLSKKEIAEKSAGFRCGSEGGRELEAKTASTCSLDLDL